MKDWQKVLDEAWLQYSADQQAAAKSAYARDFLYRQAPEALAAAGYAVVEVRRVEALVTKLRRNFEHAAAAELEDMIAAAKGEA